MKNQRLKRVIKRSIIISALFIPVVTVLTKYLYKLFEGKDITLPQSLIFVMQTITTTGYGELLPFSSAAMNIYTVVIMLFGLGIIFIVLSTAATQWLHDHFEEIPPMHASDDLKNHVILCGYNPLTESIIDEIEHHKISYLIIEKNTDMVRELMYKDIPVILGDPLEREVLQNANIQKASAVIVSSDDSENIKLVLEARALTDSPIYVALEHIRNDEILKIAGATEGIFPKHVLGEELAKWSASIFGNSFFASLDDTKELVITEFPIGIHCRFANMTIKESRIKEMTGAMILGMWQNGFFQLVQGPDEVMTKESIIVVLGTMSQVEKLSELLHGKPRILNRNKEKYLIAGYGEAAQKTVSLLKAESKDIKIIIKDYIDDPMFIAGDITSTELLLSAGITEATTYLISVDRDDDAILSSLIARHLNPNMRIIARANSHQNIAKLYRAGADFVLSFSKVGARMMSSKFIKGHNMDIPRMNIQFFDHPVSKRYANKSISELDIFKKSGCLVIAVKNDKEVITNPSSDMSLFENDILILLGSVENAQKFTDWF